MLKIGAVTWGECEKCVHYDDEDGCRILDEIEISVDENSSAVLCLSGILSEIDGRGEE